MILGFIKINKDKL